MKRSILFFLPLLFLNNILLSQHGSQYSFHFLNLAMSPRVASIGGTFLPMNDDDILLALHNPALINENIHHHIGFTFLDYYAGIKSGNVAYSRTFDKYGCFLGGVRFLHYGTLQRTDPSGNDQGYFSASDLALTIGWGRELHPGFSLGASLNLILINYDVYSSFAMATDIAGHYTNPDGRFNASLIIRNAGRQIDAFSEERDKLPFEIAGGISQKLEHAPLRFYFLLNSLHKWDLTYEDPLNPSYTTDPITGEVVEQNKVYSFLDKAMRHVGVGVEFMPGEIIRLRLGYNYRLRQEMGVRSKMGLVGFSWGLGIKLGKYQFDFSRSRDHLAGAPNYFSVSTDLNRFVNN